jgi:hypothetical protein
MGVDSGIVILYDQFSLPMKVAGGRYGGGQPVSIAGGLVPIGAEFIPSGGGLGDYALKVSVAGGSFSIGTPFETPFGPGPNTPSQVGVTTGWWDRAGTFGHSPAFVYNVDPAAPVNPALPPGTPENVVGVVLRKPAPADAFAFGTAANPVNITGAISLAKDPFFDPFPSGGFGAGYAYGAPVGGPAAAGDMAPARVFDGDATTPGAETVLGVNLRKAAPGGSVALGTLADPLRVDPTGTTPQPVSGTVTADQGAAAPLAGAWPIEVTDGAGGLPVTATTPFGAPPPTRALDVGIRGGDAVGDPGPATITLIGTSHALDVNIASGTITGADETRPATAAHSVFAVTALPTNLSAPNAARRGLTFQNRSTSRKLYLLFQTVSDLSVSSTKFTVEIAPGGFYEVPFPCFDGSVDGVWSAGTPGGDCQITELTP